MVLQNIVRFVNDKLAGEMLTRDELLVHLDSVVDDINTKLNSKFPSFSEFTSDRYEQYPDYNFFPDKYIRSVVIPGVAHKVFVTDEEGIDTATSYGNEYYANLFYMERDYLVLVPEEFREDTKGYAFDYEPERGVWVNYGDII